MGERELCMLCSDCAAQSGQGKRILNISLNSLFPSDELSRCKKVFDINRRQYKTIKNFLKKVKFQINMK